MFHFEVNLNQQSGLKLQQSVSRVDAEDTGSDQDQGKETGHYGQTLTLSLSSLSLTYTHTDIFGHVYKCWVRTHK